MSAEHELTEVRVALTEACQLLEQAVCPNKGCDDGLIHNWGRVGGGADQCQWCAEKKKLLDEHG